MNDSDFDPNKGYLDNAYDSIPALGTKKDGFMPSFFIAVISKHLVFWIKCSCRHNLDIHS